MKLVRTCLLGILCSFVGVALSLECAKLCAFVSIPVNQSIPVNNSCTFITRNNSQCSVLVETNHGKNVADGRLGIEACTGTLMRRLETIITLDSSIYTKIQYSCVQDRCDAEFINTLFPSNNGSLESLTNQQILQSLYTSSPETPDFVCRAPLTCSSTSFCQVKFSIIHNRADGFVRMNETAECLNDAKPNFLLHIKQDFNLDGNTTEEMIVRCNIANCTDNSSTIENIYRELQSYFNPEPYNTFLEGSNETCSVAQSKGVPVLQMFHRWSHIVFVLLILYYSFL